MRKGGNAYECSSFGLEDDVDEDVVEGVLERSVEEEESTKGPDLLASRWAAMEKRRQNAGSRIPAIVGEGRG